MSQADSVLIHDDIPPTIKKPLVSDAGSFSDEQAEMEVNEELGDAERTPAPRTSVSEVTREPAAALAALEVHRMLASLVERVIALEEDNMMLKQRVHDLETIRRPTTPEPAPHHDPEFSTCISPASPSRYASRRANIASPLAARDLAATLSPPMHQKTDSQATMRPTTVVASPFQTLGRREHLQDSGMQTWC